MKQKVFIGLSGGVDSAVSAHLLLEQGYEVVGVFMRNWAGSDGKDPNCTQRQDREAAQAVAEHLGIEFKVLDFVDDYMESVMKPFLSAYKAGLTPNPDMLCNSEIKFGVFRDACLADGADFIATGHYAKLERTNSETQLHMAKDQNKDQTYFLAGVATHQFDNVLFPLGDLTKAEVREIAEKINLPNAKRKDSQGICFVGKINVREYIRQQLGEKPGDIVDIDTNEVVGKHNGIWLLTIGQRHGLDLGGLNTPYYVCKKDVDTDTVYVCNGRDHEELNKTEIMVTDINLIGDDLTVEKLMQLKGVTTRIRHRGERIMVGAVIRPHDYNPAVGAVSRWRDKPRVRENLRPHDDINNPITGATSRRRDDISDGTVDTPTDDRVSLTTDPTEHTTHPTEHTLTLRHTSPHWAPTAGQTLVFYHKGRYLGSGIMI